MTQTLEQAEFEFKKRLRNKPKHIDNSKQPAGSPMYYYCRHCGHQSDVLPEDYAESPTRVCDDCEEYNKLKKEYSGTSI